MLRHRSIATSRYSSTSRMRTHKQGSTCGQEARIETDQRLPLPRANQPLRSSGTGVLRRAHLQLATLAVDSFGRLGEEGSDLIDQVAISIVGGTDASSLARKGVCMQEAPIPKHLCDHSGRDFAQSSSI